MKALLRAERGFSFAVPFYYNRNVYEAQYAVKERPLPNAPSRKNKSDMRMSKLWLKSVFAIKP
jgi:hypothetical protein